MESSENKDLAIPGPVEVNDGSLGGSDKVFEEMVMGEFVDNGLDKEAVDASSDTGSDKDQVSNEQLEDSKPNIVELKENELPEIIQTTAKSFDPNTVQDPRFDEYEEGGIVIPKPSGRMNNSNNQPEGGIIRGRSDVEDSLPGKYEVSGFTAQYSDSDGNEHALSVRNFFEDIETAKASVANHDTYLMPIKNGGFKVARIVSGMPAISFEERELFIFKEGKWVRN